MSVEESEFPGLLVFLLNTIFPVGSNKHAHCVYAMFEKCSDGSFAVKVVKQKQMIDGVVFILQEIYGMEKVGLWTISPLEGLPGPRNAWSVEKCLLWKVVERFITTFPSG